ncbi:hypothetical protein AAVH_27411 [Aphelenchoides avenae]|nr:hypothetical protein AAVH_27411 [Aphelenchus avenae]
MSASDDLFAKIIQASQAATFANDLEIDIESPSHMRQASPAGLQVQPTVTYWKNANAYRISTNYSYSFADGRPRRVVVSLRYFHANGKPPQRILQDPEIEWQGLPPWIKKKMRAGTSYREILTILFT